jgi:protein TonB
VFAAAHANTPAGPLVPAIAVSVALHAAVLMGVPDLATYAEDAPQAPLNARLVIPEAPPGLAPATAPQDVEPERAKQAPQQRAQPEPPSRRERQADRDIARRPATRTEASDAAPPQPTAVPEPAVASAAPSAHAEPASFAGDPTLAPRAAPEALDLGSLAQYRLALIGTAKRHKLYPAYAVERGWQGRVSVELAIGADGTLAAAHIKRSSGHEVLDREAVEMLRKATALTPVPPALRSREFRLDVPVLFELSNG